MSGLEAPLATGATMRPVVRTELRGSGAPSLALWSAAPDVISVSEGRITGQREGVSAIVMSMRDGTAIDFVHVWVRTADRIQLHRMSPGGDDLGELRDAIELMPGESVRVLPRPYADAQRLLGEGDSQWRVDPPLVDVLRDGAVGRRRLVAKRPGKATLTVSSLGVSSALELVIHDEEPSGSEVMP